MNLIKEEVVDSNGLKRSKAMVLRINLTLRRFHGDLVFYKSPNEFSSLLSPFLSAETSERVFIFNFLKSREKKFCYEKQAAWMPASDPRHRVFYRENAS